VNLRDVLAEAVARIVYCREAVELGEYALAAAVLRDLEEDLVATVERATEEGSA
jgi:hypothetical protein